MPVHHMPPTLVVRAAATADAAAVVRLYTQLVTAVSCDSPLAGDVYPGAEERFREAAGDPDVIMLVAAQGEQVTGYVVAQAEGRGWLSGLPRVAVIRQLAVDETRRGQGLGRALIGELVVRAAAAGLDGVDAACVWPGEAAGFYEHLGFQVYARRMHLPA